MMGHLRHECLVVHCWDDARLGNLHSAAAEVLSRLGLEGLLSPIVPAAANGGGTFMVAVDGSKEGWNTSNDAAAARSEIIAMLEDSDSYAEWALILLGGDDGLYSIELSPGEISLPAPPHA